MNIACGVSSVPIRRVRSGCVGCHFELTVEILWRIGNSLIDQLKVMKLATRFLEIVLVDFRFI